MSKPLFHNVGGEIKLVAESKAFSIKFCYGLLAVMIIAFGILLGIESDSPMLVFVAFCIAGVVFYYGYTKAQMTVLELYAYGELVEKVVSIENQLSTKGSKKGSVSSVEVKRQITKREDIPEAVVTSDGSWVCPFCDHVNSPNSAWCAKCNIEANIPK